MASRCITPCLHLGLDQPREGKHNTPVFSARAALQRAAIAKQDAGIATADAASKHADSMAGLQLGTESALVMLSYVVKQVCCMWGASWPEVVAHC